MNIETRDYAPHVVRATFDPKGYIKAMFGLHHLKGNALPHFSITAEGKYPDGREFGGCCHDQILTLWPDLAPLVTLHLSDVHGVPMHAEANGWYWVTGMIGGAGEKYHPGTGDYPHTPDQCATTLATHLRISVDDAWALAEECHIIGGVDGYQVARAHFARAVDSMRPRWKNEADFAIRRWQLGVFGDKPLTPQQLRDQLDEMFTQE